MKQELEILLRKITGEEAEVSVPEVESLGEYSTNLPFKIAKKSGKDPAEVSSKIKEIIDKEAPEFVEKIESKGGFLNFWIKPEALSKKLEQIYEKLDSFGKNPSGKGKKIILEFSQPNIAKKMHVGHLRNTVFGAALANIFEMNEWKVIRWNYLGDWGTQFGKLIAAYKMWGKEEEVKNDPINELLKLYVKFHAEAEKEPSLEDRGREEFKKLEEGDEENKKLWEWFREESLKEFKKMYKILGVDFEEWKGESFFEKEMKPLTEELKEKGLAEESEGALIIKLDKFGLPPALVQRKDGASLYLTRDIANLRYRLENYKPEKVVYVVGNEQSLHFEQLFAIAKILGLDSAELIHAKYGLVLGEDGKKLSTREGKTVGTEDVIQKAIELALKVVEEKNPDLDPEMKAEVSEAVGIGALKYFLLRENRMSDIVFDWKRVLDIRGDSAPYLQYTYARLRSIERKSEKRGRYNLLLTGEEGMKIIRKILEFPDKIQEAARNYGTNGVAEYLYGFGNLLNHFYETTPVLKEENEEKRNALLLLIYVSAEILKKGLNALGIEVLEQI